MRYSWYFVKSENKLKRIICPKHRIVQQLMNFWLYFSYLKQKVYQILIIKELNKKESPRLDIALKFLKMIELNSGIKIISKYMVTQI